MKGDLKGAAEVYRRIVLEQPRHARAHNALGTILYARGEVDGALREFRAALELDPTLAEALNNLGLALRAKGDLSGAVAAFRGAIALEPANARTHNNLGLVFSARRQMAEAERAFREAIRLDPRFVQAHFNLGRALRQQNKLAEATAAFREAIRLRPESPQAHFNLGSALAEQGKRDEALAAYRQAIRLKPDFALAYCALGLELRKQGRLVDSLAALRRGHELGSKQPGWPYPSAQWARDAERFVALEKRLPDVLSGKLEPGGAAELVGLAQVCGLTKQFGASARLYAKAFAADPKRLERRYDAACSAARAAAGEGKDAARLTAAERAALRRQALAWLEAELKAQRALLDEKKAPPALVVNRLAHWLHDGDLASARGPALAALPEAERAAWQRLWADVEALRKRAGG
jgi:Flp pilus assembly protein TadD